MAGHSPVREPHRTVPPALFAVGLAQSGGPPQRHGAGRLGPTVGLPAVRFGGVEAWATRRLDPVAPSTACSPSVPADQQYPFSDLALGAGAASGQSSAGTVDRSVVQGLEPQI